MGGGGSAGASPSRTLAYDHGCNRTASHGVAVYHLAAESRVRYPIPITPLSRTHDLKATPSVSRTYPAIGVHHYLLDI